MKVQPMELAQCRLPGLAISNAEKLIYFQIKYMEAIILSHSTLKLLWFEITKMLIAFLRKNLVLCHLLSFSAHFRSLWSSESVSYRLFSI